MPSAAYFRRQADICLRLSLIASDDHVSDRLVTMAREYMSTSEALERETGVASAITDQGVAPEADSTPPALGDVPGLPGSSAES
jgi:hypothetical protein